MIRYILILLITFQASANFILPNRTVKKHSIEMDEYFFDIKNGWGLYIIGGLAYWKIGHDRMVYAFTQTERYSHRFRYNDGFYLSVGNYFFEDHLRVAAAYRRIHFSNTTITDTANLYPNTGLMFANDSPASTNSVSSKWVFQFDNLDTFVYCSLTNGDRFILSPAVGTKSIWLDRIWTITSNVKTATAASDSWLHGLHMGMDGKWNLFNRIHIDGSIFVALLYQNNRKATTYGPMNSFTIKERIQRVVPHAYIQSSIGWDNLMFEDNIRFCINLGYEFFILFNQTLFDNIRRYGDGTSSDPLIHVREDSPDHNLFLHGGILTFTVHF